MSLGNGPAGLADVSRVSVLQLPFREVVDMDMGGCACSAPIFLLVESGTSDGHIRKVATTQQQQ